MFDIFIVKIILPQFALQCNSVYRKGNKKGLTFVSPFGARCETCKEQRDGIGIEAGICKLIAYTFPSLPGLPLSLKRAGSRSAEQRSCERHEA